MSRYTEQSNTLTASLSTSLSTPSPGVVASRNEGFVRLLRASDAEIGRGYDGQMGLYECARSQIVAPAKAMASSLASSLRVLVVLSGCGTSGRLAFHTSRSFARKEYTESNPTCGGEDVGGGGGGGGGGEEEGREVLMLQSVDDGIKASSSASSTASQEECRLEVEYLIAGGDYALLKSQERGEDDTVAGVRDLLDLVEGGEFDQLVYVGITCGLSAPYVAGQIQYLLDLQAHPESAPPSLGGKKISVGLVGFNPVALARDAVIEGVEYSFRQVALELESRCGKGSGNFIINPVVGPEPVTGSTRMKGGTATKIILEALLRGARVASDDPAAVEEVVMGTVSAHLAVLRSAYQGPNVPVITRLVEAGGAALRTPHGRIVYVGFEFGVGHLGIIDASECPPTYGASSEDVRGFVLGGWGALGNRSGDLSLAPKGDFDWQLDVDFLLSSLLPSLENSGSLVIVSLPGPSSAARARFQDDEVQRVVTTLMGLEGVGLVGLHVGTDGALEAARACVPAGLDVVHVAIPDGHPSSVELGFKLVANAITTGAHVMKGKVVGNMMIDLAVSNSKLLVRATGIVARYGNVDMVAAKSALLRAVYDDNVPSEDELSLLPDSAHIIQAMSQSRVVPKAILLARGVVSSVPEAAHLLATEPMIGNLLQ